MRWVRFQQQSRQGHLGVVEHESLRIVAVHTGLSAVFTDQRELQTAQITLVFHDDAGVDRAFFMQDFGVAGN